MNLTRLLPLASLFAVMASMSAAAQGGHVRRGVHPLIADVGFDIEVRTTYLDGRMVTADYPVVKSVRPSAEQAGLKSGDVILAIDGRDSRDGSMFADVAPGRKYRLHVRRGGNEVDVEVEATAPKQPPATSGS